jgi:glycosyltransferase involved in cell wall biosynthesis
LYNHVDVAISVGQNNRDYYSWCGLPDDRIAFAPHSIDNRRFADPQSVAERHAADWRAKLNIPDDAIVFLFAGKFVPKKAPELLLESFLKTRMPAHLIFLGNGELEGKLRQRAAGHDNVHFIPFQNQSAMPTVYRLADVFVLPSCGPGETWGLAINEAMACGRAVVASTKVGGARDLVQPAVNGWIFESGNAVELESLVANIVDSGKERLRSMGANGQSLIQRWSTEACAQQMSEVIHANA